MSSKWMVDCNGQGEGGRSSLDTALKDGDFVLLIDKQGSLASSVHQYIESLGCIITDRGAGSDGNWHLGVGFDSLDSAVDYVNAITSTFRAAIHRGLLCVSLKTWSQGSWT